MSTSAREEFKLAFASDTGTVEPIHTIMRRLAFSFDVLRIRDSQEWVYSDIGEH